MKTTKSVVRLVSECVPTQATQFEIIPRISYFYMQFPAFGNNYTDIVAQKIQPLLFQKDVSILSTL